MTTEPDVPLTPTAPMAKQGEVVTVGRLPTAQFNIRTPRGSPRGSRGRGCRFKGMRGRRIKAIPGSSGCGSHVEVYLEQLELEFTDGGRSEGRGRPFTGRESVQLAKSWVKQSIMGPQ